MVLHEFREDNADIPIMSTGRSSDGNDNRVTRAFSPDGLDLTTVQHKPFEQYSEDKNFSHGIRKLAMVATFSNSVTRHLKPNCFGKLYADVEHSLV